ncbi:protein-glutamine gamma-glutamyltransferase 2-like isoform X2 [Carcharodon carcharias]|uniref:protein-glutamine gamma-glutamyltransferase 2-like isoform X2 n=1 Tax=Carcharodon carcharias TaxID=13397 RepID=UPI001B7EC7A3|nr:protein-glutamine gamma-glutamyltransferase 2-like isoform X2 [Carcharodon carcharias]
MASTAECVVQDVSSVDFHCEKNNPDHRTAEISAKRLIVRRGQPFHITVQFKRNQYNPDVDRFKLVAQTGPSPSETSGTKILFSLSDSINKRRWNAVAACSSRSRLSLIIHSAPNAKIGRHTLALQKITSDQTVIYTVGEFVVLLNPWCSEDEVFLNDAGQLNEYILNEQGIIFTGCSEYIQHLPWNFGQVNCNDDNGILFGKWDAPYTDGVYPGKWSGSVAILRQWNNSGCQPVCYGQCWVFAAVACTGVYCCGPAPVKAIKEGETDICYDVPFIFAEVNADCVISVYSEKGKKMKVDTDMRHVGQRISTKCVGSDDREDITNNYKYPEGSEEERRIFELADKRRVPLKPGKRLQLHLMTNDPNYNGTNVKVSAVISNKNSMKRVYTLKINAMKKKYSRSSRGKCIQMYQQEITVAPSEDKTMEVELSYTEYGELLDKYNLIRFTALAIDGETNESVFTLKDICLINPNITIQVRGAPVLSQEVMTEICFENILPVALTNCVFTLEGAGLIDGQMEIRIGALNPGEAITKEVSFIPKKMGLKKLTVEFDSDNLKDVKGYINIDIQEEEK